MNTDLKDQLAIITGGASGLGFAIANKLSFHGARVMLVDRSKQQLEKSSTALNNAELYQADVSKEGDVQELIQNIGEKFGRIDILINSAGVTGKTNIKSHEVSSEDLSQVLSVNFFGSFYTSKHVLPWMLKNNYGRILHIASIAGKEGNAGMLAYSSSKAAVIGMTKVQGKEYAETGITVNALAPAVIKTPLVEGMPEEQVKYMTDKIPMKRCGTLEEVANLAFYIVSPQNSFTTGFVFDLSGGRATY